MEQKMAMEYLANAFWQLPLLAGGAWLLLRLWKPSPAAQHRVWLGVLALGLLMPLRGSVPIAAPAQTAAGGNALVASPLIDVSGASPALDATSAASSAQVSMTNANLKPSAAGYIGMPHRVRLSATAIDSILALWLACALWGVFRLSLAWLAARRLARTSRPVVLAGSEAAEVLECARRQGVNMPDVRESGAIAGPVVVGAIHPVLLWPRGFRRRSSDEFKAALCHEIAHIRRRDYAMNLLCEAAALPLRWHPALFCVERRIRATREMACDAAAAGAMESETLYATCLLSLAQSMIGASAERSLAAGLFNGNVMEERVMRLMRKNATTTRRARVVRGAAGAAAMMAAIAVAGAFHVAPAMAQAQASAPAVKADPAPPKVTVNPVVSPMVKPVVRVPAARPIVNIAKVAPAADVNPAIRISQVMVHVAPAVNPMVHVGPIAPILQVAPVPPPAAAPPAPRKKGAHRTHSRNDSVILFDNGRECNLTPAQRARIERQLEDAQRKIAAETAKIDSPEFQKQMADAQRQVAEAAAKINSPEFKKQIQDAMRASMKVNSAEIQRQMADAQRQIAETTARLNSPEFRKQIEDQVRAAEKVNSAEIQKQMAAAQKQVADALARMKAEQKAESPK